MARSPLTAVKVSNRSPDSPSNPYENRPAIVNVVDPNFAPDNTAAKVKSHRHTLQRTFLSSGGVREELIPKCDEILTELAQLPVTPEHLRSSKINIVLHHILDDGVIPPHLDAQYNFIARMSRQREEWDALLQQNGFPTPQAPVDVAVQLAVTDPKPLEQTTTPVPNTKTVSAQESTMASLAAEMSEVKLEENASADDAERNDSPTPALVHSPEVLSKSESEKEGSAGG